MNKGFQFYQICIEEESGRDFRQTIESRSAEWVKTIASRIAREYVPPLTLTVMRGQELIGRRVFLADKTKNWTRY